MIARWDRYNKREAANVVGSGGHGIAIVWPGRVTLIALALVTCHVSAALG
jgi:hypothetical protein